MVSYRNVFAGLMMSSTAILLSACDGGVDLDINAPILEAAGVNIKESLMGKPAPEPDLPERGPLVLPPKSADLPAPGQACPGAGKSADLGGSTSGPRSGKSGSGAGLPIRLSLMLTPAASRIGALMSRSTPPSQADSRIAVEDIIKPAKTFRYETMRRCPLTLAFVVKSGFRLFYGLI